MVGNPTYTPPSASGYNSSPPADDGSQIAGNIVSWAAHVIAKVGTPLKNYIDSINTAVDAMVDTIKLAFAVTSAKSADFSVASTDDGTLFLTTGTMTATLLSAVTAGAGFRFGIKKTDADSTTVTVSINGAQTIDGLSTSLVIKDRYSVLWLVSDGSNWHVALGSNFTQNGPLWNHTTMPNLLDNPMGEVVQYGTTSTTDDTYGGCDRWYSLTQTAAISASQGTNAESGTPFYDRITQSNGSSQRMGRAIIIESSKCRHLRGKNVTLALRMALSSSANVRFAVLEWTGTADTVTSDVVNDWTSGTYTTGNFFIATTTNVLGVGSVGLTAATWADTTPLTVTVGASMNNLIIFYWTESVVAQNVTLDVSHRRLVQGNVAGPFLPRAYSEELLRCQRYYQKFQCTTAGGGGGSRFCMGRCDSTTAFDGVLSLVTAMRLEGQALTLVTDGTAADYRIRIKAAATVACNAVPTINTGIHTSLNLSTAVAAGLTAGEAAMLEATNTTAYLAVSAEL